MSLPAAQMHMVPQSSHGTSNGNGLPWGAPFPSLHLWPIQDTFAMKMVHLPQGQRVKIGRQTNNKTIPGERNAYFDSKVLSRTHAEIWEQSSRMYIKDLKSSNGTFVNNERLSPEGVESEPFEIKSEDIVEFGIDIVSEDNRSILHHKVAAKVYCVFNADDAALSARELVHYQSHDPRSARPAARQTGTGGAQMNPPILASGGKPGGLTFDHVLEKLQADLKKSKDLGADLQTLSTSMSDIQDALGGGLPPGQNGSATHLIPPQYMSAESKAALAGPHGQQAAAFLSLQNQLGETQTNLTTYVDQVHSLQDQVNDNQSLRSELAQLREQMESTRRDLDVFFAQRDDDDAKSIITVMDNEEASARVRKSRSDTNGHHDNAELATRIQELSNEVAEAVQASHAWQSQHADAMAAVRQLTERIGVLEDGIASRVADEVSKVEKRWEGWKSQSEDAWRRERETWEAERERLRGVVREWEESSRRGQEEVEDRELNESLSGEEYVEDGEAFEAPLRNGLRRVRRRRPSNRTALAVRALKAVVDETGTFTPKAESKELEGKALDTRGRAGKVRRRDAKMSAREDLDRDSSESGRDSGDTLKELDTVGSGGKRSRETARRPLQQPIHIYTVLIVAAVAGAIYWKQYKE